MTIIEIIALIIFVIGYAGIAMEHSAHINKSAFALITGTAIWALVSFYDHHIIDHHIMETGYDIFGIVVFLLAAMALVEILVHYGLFDLIRSRLSKFNISTRKQFWVITGIVFLFSAVLDNLTATIIAIQIARKFFWGRNLLIAAVGIVIAANAGGAFSPIGDVTTIMLWVAEKFDALTIIGYGFIPSLALFGVSSGLLSRKITDETKVEDSEKEDFKLTRGKKLVIFTAMISFLFPIVAKAFHLPPVVGILFGVGLTWFVVDMCKKVSYHPTHLTASIDKLVQKTDIASLTFFIGILLAVSGLSALGILDVISGYIYGASQTTSSIIVGNIALGGLSSILDNIPLTAIAIDILKTTDFHLWVLLALCVGTGGSLLSIGSAAGVIAMGMVKELSFKEYFKIGFVPALLSFAVAIGVWYVEWMIFA